MAELYFESEFYYNLRNRIDKLEIEQKNSIKLIIEHHKPEFKPDLAHYYREL